MSTKTHSLLKSARNMSSSNTLNFSRTTAENVPNLIGWKCWPLDFGSFNKISLSPVLFAQIDQVTCDMYDECWIFQFNRKFKLHVSAKIPLTIDFPLVCKKLASLSRIRQQFRSVFFFLRWLKWFDSTNLGFFARVCGRRHVTHEIKHSWHNRVSFCYGSMNIFFIIRCMFALVSFRVHARNLPNWVTAFDWMTD